MARQQLAIGQLLDLDWNAAKEFGEEDYFEVRVEAVGVDWLVVRKSCGEALSVTFGSPEQFENFLDNLD